MNGWPCGYLEMRSCEMWYCVHCGQDRYGNSVNKQLENLQNAVDLFRSCQRSQDRGLLTLQWAAFNNFFNTHFVANKQREDSNGKQS
jgi:hypothetical protein